MLKYVPEMTSIVIEEIPDMLTLAVDISNCQGNCNGCHSPFLKEDTGEVLDENAIDSLLSENFGVNCFLFLGEGNDREALLRMADYVRTAHGIKVGLYTGRNDVEDDMWRAFNYVKVGPYIEEFGPLNKDSTNQRIYRVEYEHDGSYRKKDITPSIWHRGLDPMARK